MASVVRSSPAHRRTTSAVRVRTEGETVRGLRWRHSRRQVPVSFSSLSCSHILSCAVLTDPSLARRHRLRALQAAAQGAGRKGCLRSTTRRESRRARVVKRDALGETVEYDSEMRSSDHKMPTGHRGPRCVHQSGSSPKAGACGRQAGFMQTCISDPARGRNRRLIDFSG